MGEQLPLWCDNPANNVGHEWVKTGKYLMHCTSCGMFLQYAMPKGKR